MKAWMCTEKATLLGHQLANVLEHFVYFEHFRLNSANAILSGANECFIVHNLLLQPPKILDVSIRIDRVVFEYCAVS